MTAPISLDVLPPGKKAVITSLQNEPHMRLRLSEIGFTPASVVECLYRSAMGDPTAFWFRGAVIARRAEDSGKILVLPC